jgi:hypothetical protein
VSPMNPTPRGAAARDGLPSGPRWVKPTNQMSRTPQLLSANLNENAEPSGPPSAGGSLERAKHAQPEAGVTGALKYPYRVHRDGFCFKLTVQHQQDFTSPGTVYARARAFQPCPLVPRGTLACRLAAQMLCWWHPSQVCARSWRVHWSQEHPRLSCSLLLTHVHPTQHNIQEVLLQDQAYVMANYALQRIALRLAHVLDPSILAEVRPFASAAMFRPCGLLCGD